MFTIVASRVGPVPEFGRKYSVWHLNEAGLYVLGVHPNCCALRWAKGYDAEEVAYEIEAAENVQPCTYDTKPIPTSGFTFTVEVDT
jgi:hypothetical protein